MPAVQMWISELAMQYHVIFTLPRGQHRIGRIYTYPSQEQVIDVARRGHANLETINILELAFRQSRPCTVELNLTAQQFSRLNSRT